MWFHPQQQNMVWWDWLPRDPLLVIFDQIPIEIPFFQKHHFIAADHHFRCINSYKLYKVIRIPLWWIICITINPTKSYDYLDHSCLKVKWQEFPTGWRGITPNPVVMDEHDQEIETYGRNQQLKKPTYLHAIPPFEETTIHTISMYTYIYIYTYIYTYIYISSPKKKVHNQVLKKSTQRSPRNQTSTQIKPPPDSVAWWWHRCARFGCVRPPSLWPVRRDHAPDKRSAWWSPSCGTWGNSWRFPKSWGYLQSSSILGFSTKKTIYPQSSSIFPSDCPF